MTRKDFVVLAEALRLAGEQAKKANAEQVEGVAWAARYLTEALALDNPRFDRERFYRATGLANA